MLISRGWNAMVRLEMGKKSTPGKAQEPKTEITKATEKDNEITPQEESSSEDAKEEGESGSDSDMDDDVDIAEASSDEESDDEEIGGGSSDSDSEGPAYKKQKAGKDEDGERFASAFNAIIGSKIKAYDRKDPILARNKSHLKQLESDRLNAKAKKEIKAEHRQLLERVRRKNLLPSAEEPEKAREFIEKEKKLKKTAQRGVVKLFNAVLATQSQTSEDISKEKAGQGRKEELMTEMSKNRFLDLVKTAGES